MTASSTAQQLRAACAAWLTSQPDAALVGESVGRGGGFAGTTEGLRAEHPDAVFDTTVGERSTLGFGLGLALAGRPVCVELSGPRALLNAAPVVADLARLARTDFRPALTVRVPCGHGAGALLDPAVAAWLLALDGLQVHIATAQTAAPLLTACLSGGAHVLLEPATMYAQRAHADDSVAPGRLRVLRDGRDVLLASWGEGVDAALRAAEQLAHEGIDAQVVDVVSLNPLDASFGERARQIGRVVAVDGAAPGADRYLLSRALDEAFLYLESPLSRCSAVPDAVVAAARGSVTY